MVWFTHKKICNIELVFKADCKWQKPKMRRTTNVNKTYNDKIMLGYKKWEYNNKNICALHQNFWSLGWKNQSVHHNSWSPSTFHMNGSAHESAQASAAQWSA